MSVEILARFANNTYRATAKGSKLAATNTAGPRQAAEALARKLGIDPALLREESSEQFTTTFNHPGTATSSGTQHMNESTHATPTTPGEPFEGGFYAGRFMLDGAEYALIVSPKAEGELEEAVWGERRKDIPRTASCNNGLDNTTAMATAGSDLARWMLALDINGFADWYLPSRDELELCYRNLKPTSQTNYCSFRDGDNPSSLPAGHPYTATEPAQTKAAPFAAEGEQALSGFWYWSSTQCSPYSAWVQYFDGGGRDDYVKDNALRARAVRRFKITP